ncbi:DUF2442 domain-containing protein [Bacillus tuaregi]|uniref:DUF2442 domain-containing protein n=1 Tax=Bacillus tuaregi TaxID=1816695 RepID=UPI0008F7EDAB|nr:DUF2442 domain-containing protein [Bacillus tuaregi]
MRIKSFYATKNFLLIMEFDDSEYRILNMQRFLQNEEGLLKDLINDSELFMTADLDNIAGTIRWSNGVDFDPEILEENSVPLDELINKDCEKDKRERKKTTPRKVTRLPDDYKSELSKQNEWLIKLLNQMRN